MAVLPSMDCPLVKDNLYDSLLSHINKKEHSKDNSNEIHTKQLENNKSTVDISFISNYALSQSKTFTVKGKVYEAHTKIQLLECHVEILSATDSSVIDSTIAIQKFRSGNDTFYTSEYSMSIPKEEGEYIVRVSKKGYETK